MQLEQLDVGERLLERQSSYVAVPISNHSTCDITLPRNTILGYVHLIEMMLEADRSKEKRDSGRVHDGSGG